jgi:hypothetical protein
LIINDEDEYAKGYNRCPGIRDSGSGEGKKTFEKYKPFQDFGFLD